jgi:acetamidase/formamidase
MHGISKVLFAAGALAGVVGSAVAQDKVGVPLCDEFLAKYEACITSKAPAEAQVQMKQMIGTMRTAWKSMADNPQTKPQVETVCKQSTDAIKQQSAALGCQW